MTIRTYIKKLQKLADKYPNAKVVYSSDEEGNVFGPLVYSPTSGCFNDDLFVEESQFKKLKEFHNLKVNSICLN